MKFLLLTVLSATVFAAGCQTQTGEQNKTNQNANAAAPKAATLKLNEITKAFQDARMPLNQLEFFNAASDPDKLLGQPGQYTEKAVWQTKEYMKHAVEVFANEADAQTRRKFYESDKKFSGDYVYTHKNALVRIHKEMVPETAAKFEQLLKSL